MDPITLGLMAAGTALSIYGGLGAASKANQIAQVQGQISGYEGQINDQRRSAMELSARRQQLEVFRNTQRARAQGLNASVQQGAQLGSGLAGGQAQATDQGLFNAAGINQNLEIGRNIFGINSKITQSKIQLSNLGGQMATDQGYASLGGAISKSAGTIGNIAQGFGGGGKFGGGGASGGWGQQYDLGSM